MANTRDQLSSIQDDDFSLKEWALKARIITREKGNSRRFSASNLKSFREDHATFFRSNVTVSSTASSPGAYTCRDEIDPSTYSFTTALKALQARTRVYTWEHQCAGGGDGLTLNSKWNDAEKYICNPLSGEVPLECLSAKTLSACTSFRSRITMSAPLIYPNPNPNPPINLTQTKTTRDVGTQSTPLDLSPSPARTPSIQERPRNKMSDDSSTAYSEKLKEELEEKEKDERESKERNGGEIKKQMMWSCRGGGGGCLSLRGLWRRAVLRHRHKSGTNNTSMPPNFLYHIHGCSNE